jgi:hypothetical protein
MDYFAINLVQMKDKLVIRECLKLIHFGMGNTLITFEHSKYDGDRDVNDKGLTVGGYESAWLADLVAACALENTAHFFEEAACDGIYRDDVLVVFKGNCGPNYKSLNGWRVSKQKLTRLRDMTLHSSQSTSG